MEVGIRELRDHLSRYVEQVRGGEEIVVTDRGRPVARMVPAEAAPLLERLTDQGLIDLPPAGPRWRPRRRVAARGTVSDLVAEQRR